MGRREFIQPLRKAATSTNGCQGLRFFLPLLPLSISHCLHRLLYHSLSHSSSAFSSWLDATQQVDSLHWGLWPSWTENAYSLWCFCYKMCTDLSLLPQSARCLSIFMLCFRRMHFWAELSFTGSPYTPVHFSFHCKCIISATVTVASGFFSCDARTAINVFIWLLRALIN